MEDQGKRLLLAVGISMVLVLGWQFLQPKQQPKPTPPAAAATTPVLGDGGVAPAPGVATAGTPGTPAAPGTDATKPAEPAVPACDAKSAHTETLITPRVRAVFSECGGALASWRMVDTKYTQKSPDGKTNVPLDLVARPEQSMFLPLQVSFPESTVGVDRNSRWTLTRKSDTELEASWRSDKLEVVKTYTLSKDSYALGLKVAFKNLGTADIDQRLDLASYGYQDPNAKQSGSFSYAAPHFDVACQMAGGHPSEDQLKDLTDQPKLRSGSIDWGGVNHRYFLLGMAPHAAASELIGCYTRSYSTDPGMVSASIRFPSIKLAPGASGERAFTIYAGPKLIDQLERVSAQTGDGTFDKAVSLGMWSFLVRPMLWLLKFLQGFVGNWGLAIILLTITVKLITLFWTTKSMRSMKAMSKLKPKMDEIRTKFESDKQRMNVEMMNLYKTHSINPLGGCLPMVLQMPVWFALYRALNVSADLYQAPFVGWLNDLTRPDPYYIVPVVMTGLMFVQQKITPSTVDSAQQRMMLIMMPLMFGSFSLFFPSGLTVYILTNTLLTMAHQFWMNNTDPDKSKAAAAVASDAPAKKPDGDGGSGKSGGRGQGGGRKKPAKA